MRTHFEMFSYNQAESVYVATNAIKWKLPRMSSKDREEERDRENEKQSACIGLNGCAKLCL